MFGASGGAWLGEEEEGVEAEPLSASARLGVAGGHGYGDDDGELRSVVCARGKQRREWGPGGERRGAGGEGECVASPGVEEGGNQAGGGQGGSRRWPRPLGRAPRLCSSSWQRRKKTRGRRWAGPARWAGQLGQFWWSARVRPGKLGFSLSLSPFFYCFLFLFCFI